MSSDIGFDAQVPSLPNAGGAISGLGETFAADLSTGTGSFRIPLDLPNGPNDIGPRLALRYDTAAPSGPFGMGFSLPLPRLMRSTASSYPRFDDTDVLLLEGAGELVRLGGGAFRPQVDAGAWRAEASGDGFRATDRDGLRYLLGVSPQARLSADATGAARVQAWHLERIEDALGNAAVFTWLRDQRQLYLSSVAYGAYQVVLQYESRPDPVRWGQAGFLVITALRCSSIELRMPAAAQPLLRRWTLSYTQSPANQCSLLTGITLSGFAEDGSRLDAPPLHLDYTAFETCALERFQAEDAGARPGPLTRPSRRVDLVDWNGDGLPDLIEISGGGHARVWINAGDLTWGRPRDVGELPLFASPTAAVAFADMTGDGVADVVPLDRPLGSFVPRTLAPAEGFARPVTLPRAPAPWPVDDNTRLVDLDGDGIVDLLSSSRDALALYYRSNGGWAPRPQVVPRRPGPDVDLADPHVFVADMTGDGSPDLVRVDGGGVTYFPYLGSGTWASPVTMRSPPALPFDLDPVRLFLTDVDGDGCADVVYLDRGRVLYWINQGGGSAFSSVREIDFVPTGQIADLRLADMRGSGTNGLLWSAPAPLEHGTNYFYLDFTGSSKPYLLERVDNGVGLVTEIAYTTSASEFAADARAGQPWSTTLPVTIPVVARMTATDAATGRQSTTTYRYHDGRYDGVLREFAGFGRVDEDQVGDASAPTLRTTTWFHIGVDPAAPGAALTADQRRRLRAVRGRILMQERFGLDGSALEDLPYDRLEQTWTIADVSTPGGMVQVPRLASSVRSTIERTAGPVAVLRTDNISFDASGNVTESVQTVENPADRTQTTTLRTVTRYATDPAGRFVARVFRIQQLDGSGAIVADAVTEYDHAPEGQVGAQGLVTRKTALVLTDELAASVYGASLPDFAALGYFRRPGENGWWITQAVYQRTDDATGLHGEVTGPTGAVALFDFDQNKTFPTRITDARGNTVSAEHDYRVSRVSRLTDGSGATYTASFDALARRVAIVEPGDTAALPTHAYSYGTASLPVEAGLHQRADSGAAPTVDTRELFDGQGKLLERRARDDAGEIVVISNRYSSRGFLASAHQQRRPPSGAYSVPDDAWPHATYQYDALGRLVRQENVDGSVHSWTYGPLFTLDADEEDTRTGPGATHAGTPTLRRCDATGHLVAFEQNLQGRIITSSYAHDVKGNLVRHVDAAGNVVSMAYDLLGRTLRVLRPEQTTISVFDASGNAVEARGPAGPLVLREFDELNRPTALRHLSAASPPVVTFTYHDAGRPAPPDAGAHTLGHCVRIDDEGGTTVFDYDERGRLALKRSSPTGSGRTFDLDYRYRADGQLASITYPDGGAGRLTMQFQYDSRGKVIAVPSVVSGIDYDLAGRRTGIRYTNGTEMTTTYDIPTGRVRALQLTGPVGVLRQTQLTTDLVGNVVRIDSPDPKLATTYVYDDLYRLTNAVTDSGEASSYQYDDVGNLTHNSDIGVYRYGEAGAAATLLTSAGAEAFTYTDLGQMQTAPWGVHTFDPEGRLTRVAAADGSARMDFTYDFAGHRVSARSTGGVAPAVDRLTPDPLYSIEGGVLVLNLFDGTTVVARQVVGGATTFLHMDHLGALVATTDGAGSVVNTLRYGPYGALRETTGAPAPPPVGFIGGTPDAFSGLLYLEARYYHPALGRFISPDPLVQDVADPFAWSPYVYCRDNPTTCVDPSGRSFLGIFVAALALVALVVVVVVSVALDVFSAGTLTPALAIGIIALGTVLGGVIGGLAANAKGGSTDDIVTGVLVGAAVGGWAAFASLFAGGAVASAAHLSGFWGGVVAGAVNGTISGAGVGFVSGFAGGKGSLDDMLTRVWQGALLGAVTGAVIGGLSTLIPKPSGSVWNREAQAFKTPTPAPAGPSGATPPPASGPLFPVPQLPAGYQTSEVAALSSVGTSLAGRAAGAAAGYYGQAVAAAVLTTPAGVVAAEVVASDLVAGAWDLGYVPWILKQIGGLSVSGKWD